MWERRSHRVAVTDSQEAAIWDLLTMFVITILIITHVNYYSHSKCKSPPHSQILSQLAPCVAGVGQLVCCSRGGWDLRPS